MKLRMFTKQRGAHHEAILIIGAVVALVGTLGFVGYNTWQGQSANADVCATKKAKLSRLSCLEAKLKASNDEYQRIEAQLNKTDAHGNYLIKNGRGKLIDRQNQLTKRVYDLDLYNRIKRLKDEIAADELKRAQPGRNKAARQQTRAAEKNAPATSTGIDKNTCIKLGRVSAGNNSCQKACRSGEKLATGYPYDYCPSLGSQSASLTASKCDSLGRVWLSSAKVCLKQCKNSESFKLVTRKDFDQCVAAGGKL